MSKKYFFLFVLIGSNFLSRGQDITHQFGKVITNSYFPKKSFEEFNRQLLQVHISYCPQYNFSNIGNESLTVSLPLSLGFSLIINKNATEGFALPLPSTHIPIVFDYDITNENRGLFVGTGYDYFVFFIRDRDFFNSNGPLLRLGYKFGKSKLTRERYPKLCVYYKKGLESNKSNTFGISLFTSRK